MPTLEEALADNWQEAWKSRTDTAPSYAIFGRAFAVANTLGAEMAAQRKQLEALGSLSAKGVSRAVRAKMAEQLAPELRRHAEAVTAEMAAIRTTRDALAKPKVDRSDLFSEVQRQEVRALLRGMSEGDRLNVLLAERDPTILLAAMTAPPTLSGLTERNAPAVRSVYLEVHHGAEMQALDERSDACTLAKMAVNAATDALKEQADLSEAEFQFWFETGGHPEDTLAA